MERQHSIKTFIDNPKQRELLVKLYLRYGKAYRMKGKSISPSSLTSEELERFISYGFIERRKMSYVLTGKGRAIGYGLLEYFEFKKRKKMNPKLWKNKDLPIPDSTWIKGKILVDIGCGSGVFVNSAAQSQAKMVFGIDLQTSLLKLGQALNGTPGAFFINAQAEALPLSSGVGEIILLRKVLPYVHNQKALAELARIAAPEAEVFIRSLGPGYFLKAALDTAKNLKILPFIYVLFVLMNGIIYYFFKTGIPIFLKKYDQLELLSIFNTRRQLINSLVRLGFSIKEEQIQKKLGVLVNIFLWAKKV